MSDVPGGPPKIGAYAVIRTQDPTVLVAEDSEIMSRVLALHLVAQLPGADVRSPARLQEMRAALLEERWADALVAWMEETEIPVDVYGEAPRVWSEEDLDLEQASMEIRMAPLFSD